MIMTKIRTAFTLWLEGHRERKIKAARLHLTHLLETTPRYWKAAAIGGGVQFDFGKTTQKKAIAECTRQRYAIAHVDTEGAFIALQARPQSDDSESHG